MLFAIGGPVDFGAESVVPPNVFCCNSGWDDEFSESGNLWEIAYSASWLILALFAIHRDEPRGLLRGTRGPTMQA